MGRSVVSSGRPVVGSARARVAFVQRWWGKGLLLLLTIALLTLAFAPFHQFYLTWVALVPWLMVVRGCRSAKTAFLWSWLGGVVFFVANMWWLAYVTGPGMIALMAVLGLYWGAAGMIIRAAGLLDGTRGALFKGPAATEVRGIGSAAVSVLLIAVIWVALEWLRGTWPLGGLAWLYLGHTQSPVLPLCQIADVAGVFGISFLLALVNGWLALVVLDRSALRRLWPIGAGVLLVVAATLVYGFLRMHGQTTVPGPTVLVVQPNYPQSNTGDKGASRQEILEFHTRMTRQALESRHDIDLVVWSETMMPPLNESARQFAQGRGPGVEWNAAHEQLAALARQYHTNIIAGGDFWDQFRLKGDFYIAADRRNAAFYYTPEGLAAGRYDKIHLVPFGEFLPFKSAFPPLYRLFLSMSPYPEEYTLTAGSPDALTVFPLKSRWRFVTPICFEDIDPAVVHRMFEPGPQGKRADFIVNITNDGWFKYNEMPQHLQAAVFRSIENRVPTARSVNTGISGFIDSVGHTHGLLATGTEGVSIATLRLDSRVTFYTRFGDVFAVTCAVVTALLTLGTVGRSWIDRARRKAGQ